MSARRWSPLFTRRTNVWCVSIPALAVQSVEPKVWTGIGHANAPEPGEQVLPSDRNPPRMMRVDWIVWVKER